MAGKYKTNRFYWNAPQSKERPEDSGAGIWQKQYYSLLFVRHSKDRVGETEYQKIYMYKQVHKSQQAVKFKSQKVCKVHCAITIITVLWFSNHCLTSTTTYIYKCIQWLSLTATNFFPPNCCHIIYSLYYSSDSVNFFKNFPMLTTV